MASRDAVVESSRRSTEQDATLYFIMITTTLRIDTSMYLMPIKLLAASRDTRSLTNLSILQRLKTNSSFKNYKESNTLLRNQIESPHVRTNVVILL